MKNLKSKALKILVDKQLNGDLNNSLPQNLFKTAISFTNNELFENSIKTLNFALKYQNRKGLFEFNQTNMSPICFLSIVCVLAEKQGNYNGIKQFIKPIRRSIEYLEKHFCETYLLIYSTDMQSFIAKENAQLLSILDDLSQTLAMNEYHKESDFFFMLKGKMELGFSRYFWQKDKIISMFNSSKLVYSIATDIEALEILGKYCVNTKYYKELLDKLKKEVFKNFQISQSLTILKEMKESKDKTWEKEFEKNKTNLGFFPELIIPEKEFIEMKNIQKSLLFKPNKDIKELKKEKKVLININSLEIANQILDLINEK